MATFGEQIIFELRRRGKTVSELCRVTAISRATMERIFNQQRQPRSVTMKAIADYFGWPYDVVQNVVIVGDERYGPSDIAPDQGGILTTDQLKRLGEAKSLGTLQDVWAELMTEIEGPPVVGTGINRRQPKESPGHRLADETARPAPKSGRRGPQAVSSGDG